MTAILFSGADGDAPDQIHHNPSLSFNILPANWRVKAACRPCHGSAFPGITQFKPESSHGR
jgi:hypothetical protein